MNKNNGCFSIINGNSCGCEGTDVLTPLPHNNRPGLSALSYRIGTHASFLESMKARLSSAGLAGNMTEEAKKQVESLAEQLKNGLTARDSSDPSIALLDAWAVVADVLTFYQERIANEGYLRTATEERSIHELSQLVGFRQRTGVAASTVLAYTIDPNTKGEVVIPAGSRVQSVPGQNELPQTFESSEDLKVYAELNVLKPRMSKAQRKIDIFNPKVYLTGINTNLKQDDRVLIEVGSGAGENQLYRVVKVVPDAEAKRTCVELYLEELSTILDKKYKILTGKEIESIKNDTSNEDIKFTGMLNINIIKIEIEVTLISTSLKEGDKISITIDSEKIICRVKEDVVLGISGIAEVKLAPVEEIEISRFFAFRTKTAPFGHNAPLKPYGMPDDKVMRYVEWQIDNPTLNPDEPTVDFIYSYGKINSNENVMIDLTLINISKNTTLIKNIEWIWRNGDHEEETSGIFTPEEEGFNSFKPHSFSSDSIVSVKLVATLFYKIKQSEKVYSEDREPINISNLVFIGNPTLNITTTAPPYTKEDNKFIINFTPECPEDDKMVQWEWKIFSNNGAEPVKASKDERFECRLEPGDYIIKLLASNTIKGWSSSCQKDVRVYDPPIPDFVYSLLGAKQDNFTVKLTNTSVGITDNITWESKNGKITDNKFNDHSVDIEFSYQEEESCNYDVSLSADGPGSVNTTKSAKNKIEELFFFSEEIDGKKIILTNRSIGGYAEVSFACIPIDTDGEVQKDNINVFIVNKTGNYMAAMTWVEDDKKQVYSKIITVSE